MNPADDRPQSTVPTSPTRTLNRTRFGAQINGGTAFGLVATSCALFALFASLVTSATNTSAAPATSAAAATTRPAAGSRNPAPASTPAQTSQRAMAFLPLQSFPTFTRSAGPEPHTVRFTSPALETSLPWDELIVSWNVAADVDSGFGFEFEVRPVLPGSTSAAGDRFYHLGHWSRTPGPFQRESVNGQKDALAQVQTDTLVLQTPARAVQIRITVRASSAETKLPSTPPLQLLTLSLLERNRFTGLDTAPASTPASGLVLPVPERSQVAHEGGREWCSPTSVSMVLAYWGQRLGRTDLDLPVPQVAAAVHDPKWPGTGNWPFNTAYAGSFPGLHAYVTRLADVNDLAVLLQSGVPPILSVSFDLLSGKEKDEGTGHLVVCTGLTPDGQFVVNDPWAFLDRGERVQRTVPRARLARAWARSRGAVYLIHPKSWPMPAQGSRQWLQVTPPPAR